MFRLHHTNSCGEQGTSQPSYINIIHYHHCSGMPLGYRVGMASQTSHGPVSFEMENISKSPYTTSPPLPLSVWIYTWEQLLPQLQSIMDTLYWVYNFTSYTWHTHFHPIDYNIVSTTKLTWWGYRVIVHMCTCISLSLSLSSPPPSLLPLTHSYKLCHRRGLRGH